MMLETKRRVIGQLIVCQGCCCGATDKDRPAVPSESVKEEWRKHGLLKRFQLTVSGCVGPCDVPNVVVVHSESGSQWLGNITQFNQYRSLVEWACRSVEAGHLLELPREFKDHRMEPWR
jgi:cobaltochelatase CobN